MTPEQRAIADRLNARQARFIPFDTFDPPPAPSHFAAEQAYWARLLSVPNRLYGTTINSEGDAI